jgi:hypothetical protein
MAAWAGAVRRWHASCARAGSFGSQLFWETQYKQGKAAPEWFLSAELAASSTAEAFGAHEKTFGSAGTFARVLHLGCGVSQLGTCLVSSLSSQLRLSARIMNTDSSATAVSAAAAAVGTAQQQQAFRTWDVTSDSPPPSLPSTLFSCGATSRYDLLVDKGVLDAVCFASADELVAYFASVRRLLQSESVEVAAPALLVHFTDDPPEVRSELLRAAFPSNDDERWRIGCSSVEADACTDGMSETSAEAWSYYRYTVHIEPSQAEE